MYICQLYNCAGCITIGIYICLVGDQVDASFLIPDQPRAVAIDTVMYVLEDTQTKSMLCVAQVHVVSCHL